MLQTNFKNFDKVERVAIFGSTGFIGRQTLDVIRTCGDIEVYALTCNKSIEVLVSQIEEFKPKLVCIYDETKLDALKSLMSKKLSPSDISQVKILTGLDGLNEIAMDRGYDLAVCAIVGMIGLRPTVAAISSGKNIALANKEVMVCAGEIINDLLYENNVKLFPIDSEHSAIAQCLAGEDENKIDKIILTCSGGPFYKMKKEELREIDAVKALQHPIWSMGKKITIDSSTLVNKGLEVLEAKWLFKKEVDDIQVLIQRGSIIHSMVQYVDGSIKAQLSVPSMTIPIEYALYGKDRRDIGAQKLDFNEITNISFDRPDMETFKGLSLAYAVGKKPLLYSTVFNSANEEAVALFLESKISFLQIADFIEEALKDASLINAVNQRNNTIENILITERETRDFVQSLLI